jgi:tRNA threonylcarbamoyl adenosine modification protein (Sua5/YciO/YrdC/YwlC family)
MYISINPDNINHRHIEEIVDLLNKDGVIIYPTDTVYALGCKLTSKKALNAMAHLKGIKLNKANFALVFDSMSNLSEYVKQFDRPIFKLLNRALPGPFTFIMEATNALPKLFDSNKKEVGIRIPDNPIAMEIVKALGVPLATTSLYDENDDIMEYYIDASEILEDYEDKVDAIVDGGLGKLYGSTVVSCIGGQVEIIRQGLGELPV